MKTRQFCLTAALLFVCAILTGCGETFDIISKLPDAENILFTSEGRLFVTGGSQIWEIVETDDGELTKSPLYPDGGNFTGMAEYDGKIFTICSQYVFMPEKLDICDMISDPDSIVSQLAGVFTNQQLLSADLNDPDLSFTPIYTFENMLIPNGMVADSEGRLYVADETFLPMGKIIRLTINGDTIDSEEWLTPSDGCYSPNGMAIDGDTIYFSDFQFPAWKPGRIKKVEIQTDGSPGSVSILYKRNSLFDDLTFGEFRNDYGIIAADFISGTLVVVEDRGTSGKKVYESPFGTFQCPSSVAVGQSPLFSEDVLLITEKGMLFDQASSFGNRLSGQFIED